MKWLLMGFCLVFGCLNMFFAMDGSVGSAVVSAVDFFAAGLLADPR